MLLGTITIRDDCRCFVLTAQRYKFIFDGYLTSPFFLQKKSGYTPGGVYPDVGSFLLVKRGDYSSFFFLGAAFFVAGSFLAAAFLAGSFFFSSLANLA